ncbi:hypothetical protein [Sulfurimonas sp.]|uniref:hypothetical protein n=1 Tax=Sulfurimonas sp. TaxID=2022749 RepID=UPI003D11558A
MKNKLYTLLLVASLGATASLADESLIGIEGGGSTFNVDKNTGASKDYTLANVGLKIGAQSDDYRAFLSVRYYDNSTFTSMVTYGGELQYLLNVSSMANFFLGVNAGVVDLKMKDADSIERKVSHGYIGGDAGFNVHVGDNLDVEIGARIINVDAQNVQTNGTYQYNNLITGYGSLIYKFHMN